MIKENLTNQNARLFVIDEKGNEHQITDLYWFEEIGVHDFDGQGICGQYKFRIEIDPQFCVFRFRNKWSFYIERIDTKSTGLVRISDPIKNQSEANIFLQKYMQDNNIPEADTEGWYKLEDK